MSSLGIYTKTASPSISDETFSARKTLFKMLDVFGNLVPEHRTAQCLKHPSSQARYVEIRKSKRGARYNNLCVCGRVWTCPYCANRISSHRRTELAYGVGKWLNSNPNNQVSLATYTIQHDHDMSLTECLKVLSGCYRQLHSGKWYQSRKTTHKIIGSVRTVELTWGTNGYHTHIHELIFHESDNWTQLCEDMASKWMSLTHSVGNMTNHHGFDFQCAKEDVYAYVAKHGHLPLREWSLAHEVTRSAVKSGKENRTYMKVLFDISHGKVTPRDRRFITAYCNGMNGVRQLVWSNGLKDLFGIGEIADERISELSQEDSSDELYAVISLDAWKIINDKFKRGEVLQKASELQFESFQFWIKSITCIDTVSINTAKDPIHLMSGGVARVRAGDKKLITTD